MGEIETLGIVEEIQTLVSDKLQVVSYKWLSRNFLLPACASKRLLQDFVGKHGNGLEVVYTLSGWLKNDPSAYHVKLVSEPNLDEAKKEFDGNCSVQVYSVQASIPKDPAALWNAEFLQAEELFKQPAATDNCLRDNRFCGISNSFVKRNLEGTSSSIALPQPKFVGKIVPPKSNTTTQKATIPQPEPKNVKQPSPKVGVQSSNVVIEAKTESNPTERIEQTAVPSVKEKVPQKPANKKKGLNEKNTSGNGSSLANMWGRASAKPKATSVTPEATTASNLNPNASAEAQISAHEVMEDIMGSDDEDQNRNFKRTSNGEGGRKRRVVFDFSDEEDEFKDAVNLASPDPPTSKYFLDETTPKLLSPEKKVEEDIKRDSKPEVEEEKTFKKELNLLSKNDSSVVVKGRAAKGSSSDKLHTPENNVNEKNNVAGSGSTSPKRRKVLKKRIDERGREVTEVVWEGDEKETKDESSIAKKPDETIKNAATRAPVAKKSPAVVGNAPSNAGGKTGNKKGGNSKDPKQGNIMSFFKKV